jgi:hypothetical protein
MKRAFKAILLTTLLILVSCTSEDKKKYMPNVTGKPGDVLLVLDKNEWESELGTALRESLTEDYPYLPQREPIFNLFNTTPSSFQNYGAYSTHRNILRIHIGEAYDTTRVAYQEDVWASPQIVITLSAPDKESALLTYNIHKDRIISSLETAERNRVIRNSQKYQEISLRELVINEYGGAPYFPQGYTLKKKTDDFIWISYETTHVNQGIFIYTYPYNGEELNSLSVVQHRNEIMKKHVPSMREGSYMTTSAYVIPSFKWLKYKNRTFAETRGLWEVENDYMGGPFVCHTYLDKEQKNVIVLEGFIYAPKFDKRNYLRHVESILYSFEWNN